MIDKLTQQDKEKILSWVTNYAESKKHTSSYDVAPAPTSVEPILAEWNRTKDWLFHLFNGKFIISKNIEYYKPSNTIRQDMYEHVTKDNDLRYAMVKNFPRYEAQNRIIEMFFEENLVSNYCPFDYTFIIPNSQNTYSVKKGMKVTRAIANLAKKLNIDHDIIDKFLIAQSQVMNDAKLTGKLCISIHPLDFMTMSDNDCGWDSCMKWRLEGCYRLGTLEMMNSPCVICAYLESESHRLEIPDAGDWNSKKWRELFIVNDDLIMEIKPYPYYNETLTKESLNMIRELFPTGYFNEPEYIQPYVNHKYSWGECSFDFDTQNMYNDIYENSDDSHWGCVRKESIDTNYYLNYSGAATCAYCGKPIVDTTHTDVLLCSDCRKPHVIGHCAKCGCDITYLNLSIQIGDKVFCTKPACVPQIVYDTFIDITKYTAPYWPLTSLLLEDAEPIYLARENDNPQSTDAFCYTVRERLTAEENTFSIGFKPHYKNGKWYYNLEDITDFNHLYSWDLSVNCTKDSIYYPYMHFTGDNADIPFSFENILKLYAEGRIERFAGCYDIDLMAFLESINGINNFI